MRYHVFYSETPFKSGYYWDIDENLVQQFVKNYLRGEEAIIINNMLYVTGRYNFQVYEIPNREGTSGVVIDIIEKNNAVKAGFALSHFEKNFKNVTSRFLQGMAWGDLKDDYFNVFIDDESKKHYYIVLTSNEVKELLNNWALGKRTSWIDGAKLTLTSPERIRIYSIDYKYLSKNRGDIKELIRKQVKLLHKDKWSIEVFSEFGKDVTSDWDVKPFGGTKQTNEEPYFDWSYIHSVIIEVSQSKFEAAHYADAVESAFKEINFIIKSEFKISTGVEEDGTSLMRKAFAHTKPVFKLTDLSTESLRNIHEGYMNIFAGAMIGIRNPKAHANVVISKIEAWEKIVLASHLIKMWDNRILENEKPS